MPSDDPAGWSATELLAAYRGRTLSPVEATRACLARIDRLDPAVNAFCLRDDHTALAMARASEARWMRGEPAGLVDGIPATIKDLYLSRGWPTLRGSLTVARDQPWEHDHPAVARLREHGAVFLGKTTTPEFGWKGVTDSPLTGITRNPWNTAMTSGGSSGGAGVAAALGMGVLHIGSDGGGSIRMPAAFCGVFGFKPTFGRVPAWPPSSFGTISHMGPMTRHVADAALMLTVMSEYDPRAWAALPPDGVDFRTGLEDGVRGLRVAYSETLGHARVHPEVAALVRAAVAQLERLGAVVEATDPGEPDPIGIFDRHWFMPAAWTLSKMTPEQRALVDPGLQAVAEQGARWGAFDYLQAMSDRANYGVALSLFLDRYDLLVTPTLPIPAFTAGQLVADPVTQTRWTDWTPFTYPFNLTQQPAASLPVGLTRDGLPVGLQIVAGKHRDALVLRAARSLEGAFPFRAPPMSAS